MKRLHLQILTLVTAIALVLAITSLIIRSDGSEGSFETRLLFPDLAEKIGTVDRITVTSFGDQTILVRDKDGGWMVENRSGYNANQEAVGKVLQGLQDARLVEAKTSLAARHDDIGLGRSAVGLNAESSDTTLAEVLVGSRKRLPSGGMPGSLYVRLPEGDQTWLAETSLDAPTRMKDWLDPEFPIIISERIHHVTSTSPEGDIVELVREAPGSAPFRLPALKDGFRMKYASVGNRLGAVLAGLRFDDVRDRAALDFSGAHRVRFESFDGMAIDIHVMKDEFRTFVTLDFEAIEPLETTEGEDASVYLMAPDLVTSDIARYQALVGPWGYEIPSFKGGDLTLGIDDFIEPIPEDED